MITSTSVQCWLLYYVPNVLSDKTVSIAAIIIPAEDIETGARGMIYAADWQTEVRILDPDADLEMLNALLSEIRDRVLSPSQCSDMIHQLVDSFSNIVQLSPAGLRMLARSSHDHRALRSGANAEDIGNVVQFDKNERTECDA
jgi:hypothetical protein